MQGFKGKNQHLKLHLEAVSAAPAKEFLHMYKDDTYVNLDLYKTMRAYLQYLLHLSRNDIITGSPHLMTAVVTNDSVAN